ncbi:MAG: pantoate--beta-alanine ligase [Flavobacteriaceae bacterium]
MSLYHTLKALNSARSSYNGNALGVVPTMGALHQGHLSLIKKAKRDNEVVWVTIFVNPTQFDKKDDLDKYPDSLAADVAAIHKISPEIHIFAPTATDMYPEGLLARTQTFHGLDKPMEGADRPGHFNGVITIVAKLFDVLQPHRAYFGEKDFQQLQLIKKWAKEQHIPTSIVPCPIVREANGLAMSSRNAQLSPKQREKAGFIYKAMLHCKNNCVDKAGVYSTIAQAFEVHPNFDLHYVLCAEEDSLKEVKELTTANKPRLFVAASIAGVRLIDNIALK